jgi:hypothetical protein
VPNPRGVSPSLGASSGNFCASCLAKDRRVQLVDGRPCSYCITDRQTAVQHPTTPSISQPFEHTTHQTDPSYFSRRSSVVDPSFPVDFHQSVKYEPYSQSPPYSVDLALPHVAAISSSRMTQRHHPYAGHPASRPRLNVSTTSAYGLTPAKIASNDRHKLSEKHRRDAMGAFVQAGDVLRKGLNPGPLSGCHYCQSDAAQSSNHSSPTISPSTHLNIHSSVSNGVNVRAKQPKNDMLEESLMWEFSWVLHMVPGEVARHLEGIRELAGQMAREKENGKRNDWAKRKKWDADVRAEVLEQALRVMERESERHRVNPWMRTGPVPTPPSSRSSPTLGPLQSREGSDEEEN